MVCKKILVATDFSASSDAALEYATALARQWDALLLIVHVEEPPAAMMLNEHLLNSSYYPNPEIRRMLEAVVPADAQVRYEHRLVLGVPIEEIPRLATEEQADLIVMGSHGRTGVTRLLLGSIAEVVLRHATCPVLVLKAPLMPPRVKDPQATAQPAATRN